MRPSSRRSAGSSSTTRNPRACRRSSPRATPRPRSTGGVPASTVMGALLRTAHAIGAARECHQATTAPGRAVHAAAHHLAGLLAPPRGARWARDTAARSATHAPVPAHRCRQRVVRELPTGRLARHGVVAAHLEAIEAAAVDRAAAIVITQRGCDAVLAREAHREIDALVGLPIVIVVDAVALLGGVHRAHREVDGQLGHAADHHRDVRHLDRLQGASRASKAVTRTVYEPGVSASSCVTIGSGVMGKRSFEVRPWRVSASSSVAPPGRRRSRSPSTSRRSGRPAARDHSRSRSAPAPGSSPPSRKRACRAR